MKKNPKNVACPDQLVLNRIINTTFLLQSGSQNSNVFLPDDGATSLSTHSTSSVVFFGIVPP